MGYYTTLGGEITVTPPLTDEEIAASKFASFDGLTLRLANLRHVDIGLVTTVQPYTIESRKAHDTQDTLQAIVNALPGRTFTGWISGEGEDAGDSWRLVVRDGRAVEVRPRIVWPDEDQP